MYMHVGAYGRSSYMYVYIMYMYMMYVYIYTRPLYQLV